MKGHSSNVTALELDTRATRLFSGSADTTIKVWDLKTHTCIQTIMAHDHIVSSLQFKTINEEPFLFSASRDGTIRKHDTLKWKNKIVCYNDGEWIKQIRIEDGHLM
mmetsp:Transcript_85084/g.183460  ORF Transcript_85084/g.183460 Transcript_85084/m.183460 type:complete len:106 (-) Transcript_85084:700-1017(-)